MFVAPTVFMGFKIALMLVIITINLLSQGKRFWDMNPVVYGVIFILLFIGIYNISSAVLHETMTSETIKNVLPFNFIHPILYLLLIPAMKGERNIRKLCTCFVVIYFILMLRDQLTIVAMFNGISSPFTFSEDEAYVVTDDSIGFNSSSHFSLMFLMPIFFTLGITGKIKKKWFLVGTFFTLVQVALSGSAALIIVLALCLSIPVVIRIITPKIPLAFNIKHAGLLIAPIFCLVIFHFLSSDYSDAAIENFTNHFDSSTDIRYEQRQVLINAWKENPIFGHGYGASFVTSARGRQSGFESMYHATLATTGLIGLLLLISYYIIILKNTYKKVISCQDVYSLALLLCFISAIICSTTNPALGTFDGLVPIYACLATIAEGHTYSIKHSRY
jgi:hypothetical protein